MKYSRISKHHMALLLISVAVLVPSVTSGLSGVELAITAMGLVGVILLSMSGGRFDARTRPLEVWLLLMTVLSTLGYRNTDLLSFGTHWFSILIFVLSVVAGERIPGSKRKSTLIFVILVLGVASARDLFFDLIGWVQTGHERLSAEWRLGERGLATGRGLSSIIVFVLALPFVIEKNRFVRSLVWVILCLAGYNIVVVAQARGGALILMGSLFTFAIFRPSSVGAKFSASIIIASVIILLSLSELPSWVINSKYLGPLFSRFVETDDISNDRFRQVQLSLQMLLNGGISSFLLGIESRAVNSVIGINVHVGYVDMIVRYGFIVAVIYFLVCAYVALRSGFYIYKVRDCPNWVFSIALVQIVIFVLNFYGGIFTNWREVIFIGILIGIWDSSFRSKLNWGRAPS